uniref:Uncharacterized protein n=1 Tax=Arundo donax TaxID=35708 RepID=A0A0A8ZFI6_ARUDO
MRLLKTVFTISNLQISCFYILKTYHLSIHMLRELKRANLCRKTQTFTKKNPVV